jgi:hypothetical protein
VMMVKSKFGTTRQSSACSHSIKGTKTMSLQSLSTQISLSFSLLVRMISSIFGTRLLTEMSSN